jgi:hypothetical protein
MHDFAEDSEIKTHVHNIHSQAQDSPVPPDECGRGLWPALKTEVHWLLRGRTETWVAPAGTAMVNWLGGS